MSTECSVIVPLFNQELQLPTLHPRLSATLRQLAIPHEIIYVDDGSTDRTAHLIRELHESDPTVKAVLLSRTFGHQSALCAGLEAASGRVVITLDGDLRDPPELIPELLDKWSEGYQVVYARPDRSPASLFKRAGRAIISQTLRKLSGLPMQVDSGHYALLDRAVVEQLNAMPERTRFIPGLRSWVGFRQAEVLYGRGRCVGSTDPSIPLVRLAWNGMFAFSEAPLKFVTLSGVLICGIWAVTLGLKLAGWLAIGWTPLMMLILGGVQLLGMGMLGEYIARIHNEVRGRPLYVARERLGFRSLPRPVRNVLEFLPTRETDRQEHLTAGRLSGDGTETPFIRDSR